jgi:hypothetical protein
MLFGLALIKLLMKDLSIYQNEFATNLVIVF